MKSSLQVLALAGILGCASESYVYTPDSPNTFSAGVPASRTAIPQERPQGTVQVLSYGTADLRTAEGTMPALHVRMIVTNEGDATPWRLDTTQQVLEIPGVGRSRAMFVNASVQTLPQVTIPRRERRVLDFFFPLPRHMSKESELPQFEFLWSVTTQARQVASRTSFDRMQPEPTVAYGTGWSVWAGYCPYWWYDPFYPGSVVVHSRPIVIDHRDRRAPRVQRVDGRFRPGSVPQVTRRSRR